MVEMPDSETACATGFYIDDAGAVLTIEPAACNRARSIRTGGETPMGAGNGGDVGASWFLLPI